MIHQNNLLLKRLEPAVLAIVSPHLSVVSLRLSELLADAHDRVQNVYFPHSGIISNVVALSNGRAIETAMTGKDGQFGAAQALEDRASLHRVVMQVSGRASMMKSARLCELANELPDLRKLLMQSEEFFLAQVQQAVACNAVHDVQSRMCKWLLRMHGLAGNHLPLTHEFLAEMMGVRRPSVTSIAVKLQKAGLIKYSRGHIQIVNIEGVRQRACECDKAIRLYYRAIFQ
jgi:CRP-like cAMP-binding protein